MKAIVAVPVTLYMVYRSWSHQSLTPAGIVAATLTAAAHAIHPWSLPFTLLIVFFLAGTRVTKVKHDIKAKLTTQASGSSGGEGARTHIQVFANSGVASVLTLLHAYQLYQREQGVIPSRGSVPGCFPWAGDLLVVGIIANYAAVAADTFSSELGILSKSAPRLITSWNLRKVAPGTNGGVTAYGLLSGVLGSIIIVATSVALLPFCPPTKGLLGRDSAGWGLNQRNRFAFAMTLWGALGSLLDSLLGGWLQQSVVDTRTGKIIEGEGGRKVLVARPGQGSMHYKMKAEVEAKIVGGDGADTIPRNESAESVSRDERPSRKVESGSNLLDNNGVNFLMALTMSLGAMGVASWFWDVPIDSILPLGLL